jgi:hypothetical protein
MYDPRSAKDIVFRSEKLLRTLRSNTEPTRRQIEAALATIAESQRLVATMRGLQAWRERLGMRACSGGEIRSVQ